MFRYKVDVLHELKSKGFNSGVLMREKIFGSADVQKMRRGVVLGVSGLDRLCGLLRCQPGRIIEWVPDDPADDPAPRP